MPSLYFEVYCAECGNDLTKYATVTNNIITVSCPKCSIEMDNLKDDIQDLKTELERLEKEGGE